MCKSADIQGFHRDERDRLKIRGFYLRLSVSDSNKSVPDSLTLVYLPRINGSPLEVADSKIRPDSASFVTLHRIVSADAVFASRERVRASEGVRFEVYMNEEKVLKGIFRKDEKDEWKMECRCALESGSARVSVSEVEVCVAVEGHVAMSEMVEMAVKRKAKARAIQPLEEIPEEREVETESDGCNCFCEEDEEKDCESDCGDCEVNSKEMEMDIEGFGWAVDLGIWVMCLGAGYLLSRASSKSLRRRRIL